MVLAIQQTAGECQARRCFNLEEREHTKQQTKSDPLQTKIFPLSHCEWPCWGYRMIPEWQTMGADLV